MRSAAAGRSGADLVSCSVREVVEMTWLPWRRAEQPASGCSCMSRDRYRDIERYVTARLRRIDGFAFAPKPAGPNSARSGGGPEFVDQIWTPSDSDSQDREGQATPRDGQGSSRGSEVGRWDQSVIRLTNCGIPAINSRSLNEQRKTAAHPAEVGFLRCGDESHYLFHRLLRTVGIAVARLDDKLCGPV